MTLTRTATAALTAAVLAGLTLIAALLMPAPAAHAGTGTGADLAILGAAFPGGTDYTAAQAGQALTLADSVCDAYASLVPKATINATVVRLTGLNPKQAQRFITVSHRELCPAL